MRYEGPSIFGTLYRLQILVQQSMCRTRRIQMHTQHYRNCELRIYCQNVRGLWTKIGDFFLAISEHDYDVIVLTET